MAGIETLLVLTVAALHFAVVAGRVGPDELVDEAYPSSFLFNCPRCIVLLQTCMEKS